MPIDIKSKFIDSEMATDEELSSVESSLQSQINDKQDIISGAVSSVVSIDLNPSIVVVTNSSGKLTNSSTSTTSLGFLDATSSVQTQLNGKQAAGNYITALTGDVTASGPGSSVTTLSNSGVSAGTYDQVTVDVKGRVTSAIINRWTYKTTATQSQNTVNYTAINELNSASLPIGLYKFSAYILSQSVITTTGIGLRIGAGTATLSTISSKAFISQAADGTAKNFQVDQLVANTNVPSTAVLSANTTFPSLIEGVFRITAQGSVQVQFRSEVANSAVTIQPDSVLIIESV